MADPVLDQIYEYCKYNALVEGEERDLSFDGILCVLLYRGMLKYLPELRKWRKLNPDLLKLKRVDLVNALVSYAKLKELDENTAFNCAGLIARNISKDNIGSLVEELDRLYKVKSTNKNSHNHSYSMI